jgi:hypothetical protein
VLFDVRFRMNRIRHLLAIFCLLFASCGRKEAESVTETEEKLSHVAVLSLDFLRANQEDYLDQEVTVATFLFTHEEGPWIADNPEKPLWDGMSLKIGDRSRIIAKDSSQFRWWFAYQEGYPVMLTGVFRLTNKILPLGEVKKNHPCIEVSQALEVAIEDPEWKASRSNREQAAPSNGG